MTTSQHPIPTPITYSTIPIESLRARAARRQQQLRDAVPLEQAPISDLLADDPDLAAQSSEIENNFRSIIAEMPTKLMDAVQIGTRQLTSALKQSVAQPTRPVLPIDKQGRPYLRVNNPYELTTPLALASVQRYYDLMQEWPVAIVLNKERFFPFGRDVGYLHMVPAAQNIPYVYGGENCSYDLLVVGKKEDE